LKCLLSDSTEHLASEQADAGLNNVLPIKKADGY
jgi:hypothetical protein